MDGIPTPTPAMSAYDRRLQVEKACAAGMNAQMAPKAIKTGGSASYYKVLVENPTSAAEPYVAECNDIIESLHLTFAEANILKAIWRQAAARMGRDYKAGTDAVYDAEKNVFFADRILKKAKYDAAEASDQTQPQQP